MAVDKLPQFLKEMWLFCVNDKDEDWPNMIMYEKWLSKMAFVREGVQFSRESEKKKTEEAQIETTRFSKTSNFSANAIVENRNKCKVTTAR